MITDAYHYINSSSHILPSSEAQYSLTLHTVQLNLNFTHAWRYMRVLARLTHAKLQKLVCACTVAHNFGVHTRERKHT